MEISANNWPDVGLLIVAVLALIVASISAFLIYGQIRVARIQALQAQKQVQHAQRQVLEAQKQSLNLQKQLKIDIDAIKNDHDRSRRELAVQLCIDWSRFLEPEIVATTVLLEQISGEQCEAIYKRNPVKIQSKYANELSIIFKNEFPDLDFRAANEDTVFDLDAVQTAFLRQTAIKFLNFLESVLSAWLYGVADREIIENQFRFVLDRQDKRTGLQTFRTYVKTGSYEAIDKFIVEIAPKPRALRNPIE